MLYYLSPMLELRHIEKDYYVDKKAYPALKDVSIAFEDVGFVAILGPSGCGKTTLLNIIGGLDHYTSGDLLVDSKSTKDFKDHEWDAYRNEQVGFVFQSYNLIPHMSVLDNVEMSLLLNGASKGERQKKALLALEAVGLKEMIKKRPNQLSGGQMQRVALARAIVNNPKIILADEPTGALDSVTSVQVMKILKKLSETRLVIMVTHNRDLAFEYADRIVEAKDGEIVHDSKPFFPKRENSESQKLISKKTSMSFWTALKSSFNNIRTKKVRVILTAVASSIGIFGVALVLAVSNGFQNYVSNVEGSIASSVPITISKTSYTYASNSKAKLPEEFPSDNNVNVYDSSKTTFISHTNYYDNDYIDNVINPLVDEGLARSILVNRKGLEFNLIKKVHSDNTGKDTYKFIDQYASAGATANIVSSATSLPATIFHELYGEEKGVLSMYDCIYGKYPQSSDELVLILDRYNRVDLSTLKALGILPSDEEKYNAKISFEDILGNNIYKAYLNSTFYGQNEADCNLGVRGYNSITPHYKDGKLVLEGNTSDVKTIHRVQREDTQSIGAQNIYENDAKYKPKTLKIVGILRPSKDSYVQLMPTSIGYLSSLTKEFVEDAENNCGFIHEANEESWYIPTGVSKTSSGLVYNEADDGRKEIETAFNSILSSVNSGGTLSVTSVSSLAKALRFTRFYVPESDKTRGVYSILNVTGYLNESRKAGKDFRGDLVGRLVDCLSGKDEQKKKEATFAFLERILESSFYQNGHEKETYDIDSDVLDMDFNIADLIAYFQSYSLVTSILIFPTALTTKDALTKKLDAYNEGKEESKKIYYSDIMSTFTSSLSTLIEVLSTVLVVFASISLVVSSIMTAIITYVSVIERTKEIGILRACGARKTDVGRLFEAECVIVGFVAGLIGVVCAGLACFPISQIVDHLYPGNNLSSIASLNPLHAVVLILVSIVLAFISGLIPARIGANKDPVIALRTE